MPYATGCDGITEDVSEHAPERAAVLDEDGLVPALQDVPDSPVAAVEPLAVRGVQLLKHS
jgi:hypothetical protein